MDLGVVGFEGGLVVGGGSDETGSCFASSLSSSADPDEANKQKVFGSGQLRQERGFEDDWRCCLKVAKTEDFSASKAMLTSNLLRSNINTSPFLVSENGQQMLSFSSPNSQSISSPYYQYQPSSSPYNNNNNSNTRNTGYGYGGGGGLNAQTLMYGMRGPFTPSQWMELEHQALIYKYITANAPIPSNLLIPIRKALDSAGFYSSAGSLRSNSSVGWGGFHLGFSNSTDPEPGRCRRTDGKKWRCSRDAVPDQKYCERHLNRGRHRSRKPVEGLTGHSVSGPAATAKASPAVVAGGGSGSNSLCQSGVPPPPTTTTTNTNPSSSSHLNRTYLNKENGKVVQDRLDLSSSINSLKDNNQYSVTTTTTPTTQKSLYRNSSNQHPVRQFMDGWPSSQSDCSAFSWTNIDEIQPERTQLSISIPMASDFMSSTSSPVNKKCPLSPLRLSTQMGLGLGGASMAAVNEDSQRQANWIPISWGSSIGGPLGEVLNKTNTTTSTAVAAADLKNNSSALNLMTDGWDHSPRQTSSPTGVLQKVPFGSLSNSSAGSSPRAESTNNRTTREGASVCNYHHLAQPM